MGIRVGLMIATPDDSGQELLDGVVDYVRSHPHWTAESSAWWNPRQLADFKGFDGLLIRGPERLGKVVRSLTIPVVDVSCSYPMPPGIPRVAQDNLAIGRLAANHFLERGHRSLAFLGHSTPKFDQHRLQGRRSTPLYVQDRLRGFQEAAQAGGAEVFIFVQPGLHGWSRETVLTPIRRWLEHLPRPLAVMGDDDDAARLILEACRGHFHVPEEIAVIGVNNDLHLCELSTPALSSIDTGSRRVGFRAAALLDDLIHGKPLPSEPIAVAPGDVQVRRSSDIYAIQDPIIATAMRYIQDHAVDDIKVKDICSEVFLSSRSLELRFKQATGRSPRDQIRLVRMQRATRLLATGMSIATVASQAGFSSQSRFGQLFRRQMGMTPLAYRRVLLEGQSTAERPLAKI